MLFVMALLLWFALSIPATLIIGRIMAAGDREVLWSPRRVLTLGQPPVLS